MECCLRTEGEVVSPKSKVVRPKAQAMQGDSRQ